jgi:hypothetical protein
MAEDVNYIFIKDPTEGDLKEILSRLDCVVCQGKIEGLGYWGAWIPGKDNRNRVDAQTVVMGLPPPEKPRYILWATCRSCWDRLGGVEPVALYVQKQFFGQIEPKDETG